MLVLLWPERELSARCALIAVRVQARWHAAHARVYACACLYVCAGPGGMLLTLFKRIDGDRSGVIGFNEMHDCTCVDSVTYLLTGLLACLLTHVLAYSLA